MYCYAIKIPIIRWKLLSKNYCTHKSKMNLCIYILATLFSTFLSELSHIVYQLIPSISTFHFFCFCCLSNMTKGTFKLYFSVFTDGRYSQEVTGRLEGTSQNQPDRGQEGDRRNVDSFRYQPQVFKMSRNHVLAQFILGFFLLF